ncbi:MAG: hypothetical protein KC466_13110, partial [Myxococcales bacterium]|nr:hypothetical protein [Myxococcales bacterium]
RAAEEAEGKVRWLRPELQNPTGAAVETKGLGLAEKKEKTKAPAKQPWPGTVAAQAQALLAALAGARAPLDAEGVARRFHRASRAKVTEVLDLLEQLGKVRRLDDGRFAA